MKVACCLSGSQPITQKYKDFLQNFETVQYFSYSHPSDKFEKNIQRLCIDKQSVELNTKEFFDLCVYINTNNEIDQDLPVIKSVSANTIYTISNWLMDNGVFGKFSNFYVDQKFFYCDSKTFNVISTFEKYTQMLENEYKLPEQTFFYSFIQNMGIVNSCINNVQQDYKKLGPRWAENS